MSFCCLQFSPKTKETNPTLCTIGVKWFVLVRFLGELKIPKRHFEINQEASGKKLSLPHIWDKTEIDEMLIINCWNAEWQKRKRVSEYSKADFCFALHMSQKVFGRYALEFVRMSSKLQQMLFAHPFTANENAKRCSVTQNSELKLFYFWLVFSVFAPMCTATALSQLCGTMP